MKNVIKTIVYPYDKEFASVLKYRDMLENVIITGVISPLGWGLCGRDAASEYSNDEKWEFIIQKEITNELLSKSNTLWIVESSNELLFENIFNIIREAAEHKLNILITRDIKESEYLRILKICSQYEVKVKRPFNLDKKKAEIDVEELDYKNTPIETINTPIIFVSGTCENTNKKSVQLAIRKRFISRGYKVSQIGTSNYCELFGFHSFPIFMTNDSINEIEKIVLFNSYVKDIEINENPDIIIIGIPGGIMPINNNNKMNFGIYAYEIANSVNPDIVVMCLPNDNYNSTYFSELQQLVKYKFNYYIDCYCISNYRIDPLSLSEIEGLKYILMDKEQSTETINNIKISNNEECIFNSLKDSDFDELYNCISNKLLEYGADGIL